VGIGMKSVNWNFQKKKNYGLENYQLTSEKSVVCLLVYELHTACKNLRLQFSLPVIKVWEHETSVCSCLCFAVPVHFSNYAGVRYKRRAWIWNCFNTLGLLSNWYWEIFPSVKRPKAAPSGRSPSEILGSNPTRGMDVCFECCVLSGRGLCVELITRPGESYRVWCVTVCDLETSWMRKPWPTGGCRSKSKQRARGV
jgi:hypothetical protein